MNDAQQLLRTHYNGRYNPTIGVQASRYLVWGGYNPEQWTETVWQEDMRLMKLAGRNVVSLGIFAWTEIEPEEDCFCQSYRATCSRNDEFYGYVSGTPLLEARPGA